MTAPSNDILEAQKRLTAADVPANWTFENQKVAEGFQRHVREQLPWYDMATGVVAHIARHYISEGGLVYDIGASIGNVGNAISGVMAARKAKLVPIESSEEMVKLYRGPGQVIHADALTYKYEPFDCAILFLVCMFMPVDKRGAWLKDLASKIKPGGCIILFDKILTHDRPYIGTILRRLTLAGKVAAGTSADEIINKELSLGGVQRPMSQYILETLTPSAVKVFQFGEFAGYVIERPESPL